MRWILRSRQGTKCKKFLITLPTRSYVVVTTRESQCISWDYMDMKGLDPMLCTHNIYIIPNVKIIRQPQRRGNLVLKDMVNNELQKLLKCWFYIPHL